MSIETLCFASPILMRNKGGGVVGRDSMSDRDNMIVPYTDECGCRCFVFLFCFTLEWSCFWLGCSRSFMSSLFYDINIYPWTENTRDLWHALWVIFAMLLMSSELIPPLMC